VRRAAAVAVLIAALAAGTALAAGLQGTYTTKLTDASLRFLNGSWTIKLGARGHYSLVHAGRTTARGTWSAAGSKLTVTDRSGFLSCPTSKARGTYRWRLSGGKLKLTVIHDGCGGRETILTAHALTRR